jgi:divalent metal cation (Fe/Co/Zn/Cd) transporter
VTAVELPSVSEPAAAAAARAAGRGERWIRTARQARALSWASLAWMTVEGVVGVIAGLDAGALSVIVWAVSSFVEALASMIVIWRFTGWRTMSEHSEHAAQRLVAGSFLVLVPFFVYEATRHLVGGGHPTANALGLAITASAIVLMPVLGVVKMRLGRRLGSGATAGEGVQNLMCAAQAAAALIALVGASAGLGILDPVAALLIAGLAARESVELWRGGDDCCAPIGFASDPSGCGDSSCEHC